MPEFEPATDDYAERARASFAKQGMMAHMGAELSDVRVQLAAAVAAVREATAWLNGSDDARARMAGATPYQEMLGTLAGGYGLARQALAALPEAGTDPWMAAKVATARFFSVNLLPKVHGLMPGVVDGPDLLFAVPDAHIETPG